MPRYTLVYPDDGSGPFVKGSAEHEAYLGSRRRAPAVFGDEGDFISPIDRKVYSGKEGMRQHNARHDVVNNRDLVGLATGVNQTGKGPAPESTRQRQERRQAIYDAAMRGRHLEGQ